MCFYHITAMKGFLFAFSAEGEEQLKILFYLMVLAYVDLRFCSRFMVHALSINSFSIMPIFY